MWGQPLAVIADSLDISLSQMARLSVVLRKAGEIELHPTAKWCGEHDPSGSPLWWARAAKMDARFAARVAELGISFADNDPRALSEGGVFQPLRYVPARSLSGCAAAQCAGA